MMRSKHRRIVNENAYTAFESQTVIVEIKFVVFSICVPYKTLYESIDFISEMCSVCFNLSSAHICFVLSLIQSEDFYVVQRKKNEKKRKSNYEKEKQRVSFKRLAIAR